VSREPHTPALEALVLDLVEWVARRPRPYAEVMDAWRTSCARLPIWEEAVARGLVVSERRAPGQVLVSVTAAGRAYLTSCRQASC
jgi:D-3-phosphoglycerate dehydrogenase